MKNDMRPIDWIALVLLFVLTIVAVVVVHNAGAEALPSPDAKTLLALDGDLKLSDAPLDIHVAECLRVDIVSGGEDGTWADLTLPKVPPGIVGVALFDGWHRSTEFGSRPGKPPCACASGRRTWRGWTAPWGFIW